MYEEICTRLKGKEAAEDAEEEKRAAEDKQRKEAAEESEEERHSGEEKTSAEEAESRAIAAGHFMQLAQRKLAKAEKLRVRAAALEIEAMELFGSCQRAAKGQIKLY